MTIPERKSTWPQKDSDVYGVGCQSNKYRKDTIQVAARMHLFAVIKILTRPVALLPTLGQNADMSRTFVMYPWRLQSSHIESTTGPAANKRCGGRRHLFPYMQKHTTTFATASNGSSHIASNHFFSVDCCHDVFLRRCSDGDSAAAVDIGMTQLLWPPLMPLTWVRHHIVGAAVARSSRLQLAQAAFFHQKLTRHDLRWAVMVVARYGLVHL